MTKRLRKMINKNAVRDALTGKRVGNKEVIIVDNAVDWVKKQGFLVVKPTIKEIVANITYTFLVVFLFIMLISLSSAVWFNDSYTYKERINLSDYNISIVNLTKYIEFPINSHMNETGKDIIFTNDAENLKIPFDFDFINSSTIGFWIKIPQLASPHIYIYYGSNTATYENNSAETFSNLRHELHFNNNTNNLGTADSFTLFNSPLFRNLSNSIMKTAIYSPNSTNSGFTGDGTIKWQGNFTMNFVLQNPGSAHQYLVYDAGLSFIIEVGNYCTGKAGDNHICIYQGGWTDCSPLINVTAGVMHTITIMSNSSKVSCYVDGERQGIINNAGSPGVPKFMYRNDDSGKAWIGNITEYSMYDNFIPESWIKQIAQNNNYSSYVLGNEEVQAPQSPSFVNYSDFPVSPVNYSLGQNYIFNVTIIKGNGTQGIEFNLINYSMTILNVSNNISNFTFNNLKAGNYVYHYWAYGTGGTFNSTANFSYTINKAVPFVNLTTSPASPLIYGLNSTFTCLNLFGNNISIELLANGNNITTQNNVSINRSTDTYNLECIYNGNENYTSGSVTQVYVIGGALTSFSFFNYDFSNLTNLVLFIFIVLCSIVIMIYLSWLAGSICLIAEGVMLLINVNNKFIGLAFLVGAVLTAFVNRE